MVRSCVKTAPLNGRYLLLLCFPTHGNYPGLVRLKRANTQCMPVSLRGHPLRRFSRTRLYYTSAIDGRETTSARVHAASVASSAMAV